MSEIISKDAIRAKARAAHAAGHSRTSHRFNWHAPALHTWLIEYDRCAHERRQQAPDVRKQLVRGQAA